MKLQAVVAGDHGGAGQDGNVLEHFLAAVAETGGLYAQHIQGAAEFVDQQGGKRFAFHVFRHNQQLLAGLDNLLQDRNDFLDVTDLLVGKEDQRIVQNGFHLFRVGYHVGGQETTVNLHALNHFAVSFSRLGLFYGNDTVRTDLFHSLGDQGADLFIAGRDRTNPGNVLTAVDRLRILLNGLHSDLGCLGHSLVHHNGIGACYQIFQAFVDDGLGQQRGGCGTVAGHIVGFGGNFLYHLGAHVFKGIFQFNFLCNGDTVIGDQGRAIGSPQDHIAALRTERYFDSIGQLVNTALQCLTSFFPITKHLCHNICSPSDLRSKLVFHNCHDVALLDDGQLFAVDFHFGSHVLAGDDFVAGLQDHGHFFSVNQTTGANSDDNRQVRLLLRGCGQDNATLGGFFCFQTLDHYAVGQRFQCHVGFLLQMYVQMVFTNFWLSTLFG